MSSSQRMAAAEVQRGVVQIELPFQKFKFNLINYSNSGAKGADVFGAALEPEDPDPKSLHSCVQKGASDSRAVVRILKTDSGDWRIINIDQILMIQYELESGRRDLSNDDVVFRV